MQSRGLTAKKVSRLALLNHDQDASKISTSPCKKTPLRSMFGCAQNHHKGPKYAGGDWPKPGHLGKDGISAALEQKGITTKCLKIDSDTPMALTAFILRCLR